MKTNVSEFLRPLATACAVWTVGVASAHTFERATPESQGVKSEAVSALVDRLQAGKDSVHSYMLLRHGKVIGEGYWAPYAPEYRHSLFSVSKAFVSMGIGYAVDDRKMTVNDRVNWFFPEYVPTNQPFYGREMRVRDLLSMSSGQAYDSFDAMGKCTGTNCAAAFFQVPMKCSPGILFRYMSGNTAMLAEIHRKITGEADLVNYLRPRLFNKLGITDCEWARLPDGVVQGGSGFELRLEDFATIGQLLLQEGVWKGERLLPLWWVKQATSCQTAFGKVLDPVLAYHIGGGEKGGGRMANAADDWEQGYGYQLWMGTHETFRLCGAFGQVTIIMPSEDIVFSTQCGAGGANYLVVKAFYDTILPGLTKEAVPENASAQAALKAKEKALTLSYAQATNAVKAAKGVYVATAAKNPIGIVSCKFDADKLAFTLVNGFGEQTFTIGEKGWTRGLLKLEENACPETLSMLPNGAQPLAARGAWTADGVFKFDVRFLRGPFGFKAMLTMKDGKMKVDVKGISSKRYTFTAE